MRPAIDLTPLLGPPTGIHQATANLVDALARREDVAPAGYVLSARASGRGVAAAAARAGIPAARSRVPAAICHFGWSRLDRPRLRRLVRGADVLHGTNYTVPPGRARLITLQDLGLVTRPEWCTPAVRRMAPVLRQAVQRGAHLHVTTRAAAAEAAAVLDAEPSRVHVVPIGVRPIGPGDAAAARELVGSNRYVLALGTTEPRKNLSGLPRAVAALPPDVKLVVAGPQGDDEATLYQAVVDCALGSRFVRLADVDEQRRADLLHGASALAYPSLLEGFGLPPLEAASLGTPVAATAVGALPELLGPDIPLVAPGDQDAFRERLATVLAEPPAPSPAAQARIAVLSWARAAERLVGVYRRVIADP